jgi:hypothetical protein
MQYGEKIDTTKNGTIKTKKGEKLVITDPDVSRIIKRVLVTEGFDLIVKPIFEPGTRYFMGEEIEIFKIEQIQ